jgi:hypothetical protein
MPTNPLDEFVELVSENIIEVFIDAGNSNEPANINISETEFENQYDVLYRYFQNDNYERVGNIDNRTTINDSNREDRILVSKFLFYLYNIHNIGFIPDELRFINCSSNAFHDNYAPVYKEYFGSHLTTHSGSNNYIPYISHKDDLYYGYISRTEEAYFFIEDSCYSEHTGEYYYNDEVAEDCGLEWRECCESWYPDENSCCDSYRNQDRGREFDNTFNGSYDLSELSFTRLSKTSNIPYTFGVEIETCESSAVWSNEDLNFKAVYDGSVEGHEFVSGILQGNRGVDEIKMMSQHLRDCDALVDKSCGLHIHIGGAVFNRRFSIMLLKLCAAIENDIYSILPESRRTNTFCKLLPQDTINSLDFHNYRDKLGSIIYQNKIDRSRNKKNNHPGGRYNSNRYYWVNITNYSTRTGGNTVEFRPHSGTIDFHKIYNWLLICMSIVKFAENQQRRIWTSGMSKNKLTLNEVLKYGLKDNLYEKVYAYCLQRANRFGHTIS